MTPERYLKKSTKTIYNTQTRDEVWQELESCIDDLTQNYLDMGMTQQEAEVCALKQMGDPAEAGIAFHKIYQPKVDWKELLWFIVWTAIIGALNLLGIFKNLFSTQVYPIVLPVIGIFFMVFGICWSAIEKYMNLPFFYCWANNWGASGLGGIANAGLLGAIGTGLAARNLMELFLLAAVMISVYQGQRFFISRKRELKEQEFLWELCIAQEDFDFEGRVMIGNKLRKVRIKKGESVRKGMPLIITGIDGFMLIAEKNQT